MKKINAVVIKKGNVYFAFVKDNPAAAVSATDIKVLFDRLKTAYLDVIQNESFDYRTIHKIPA